LRAQVALSTVGGLVLTTTVLIDYGEAETDPFRASFAPLPQVRRPGGT